MVRADHYVKNPERCVMGAAPTMGQLLRYFGQDTALSWLEIQIMTLSELCGAKGKISKLQAMFCAEQILARFGSLKVTELLLYFSYLAAGKYGHFYGSVDPQRILEWIDNYMSDRNEICQEYDARKAAEEREAEEKDRRENCVTYDEYLKMKAEGKIDSAGYPRSVIKN